MHIKEKEVVEKYDPPTLWIDKLWKRKFELKACGLSLLPTEPRNNLIIFLNEIPWSKNHTSHFRFPF